MFKHLLVPLDGSKLAEAAVPTAAALAEKLGARVTLIHVIEQHPPREVHGQPHLRDAGQADAYLADIARFGFPAGMAVDRHVHAAEVIDVAGGIIAHAEELDHDLIVMCSHGRGRAFLLFAGSIAQKVIAGGALPVLIVRPSESGEVPAFACRCILVPLDGNLEHEQVLPVVTELAKGCGAELHLAMAVPDFGTISGPAVVTSKFLPGTTSKMLEIAVQNAGDYLTKCGERLRGQGFTVGAHVLRGDPATAIADAAGRLGVDLVALATHGKVGLNAFWSGSVANKVCSHCTIPLLLIPVTHD